MLGHIMIRKITSLLTKQRRVLSSRPTGQPGINMSRSLHTNWNTCQDFFRYTRGRFVWNETHELAIRHAKFDMNQLAKCAAESVGSTLTQCVRIEKFPDGMFNKTFLFTMEDGTQVVGKVPNPNAGRAHYTTASEVATMDFVRNNLGTPVPRVLDWSSKTTENSVGAEYIIMEKVEGVQLDKVWPNLDIKARFEVVKSISRYQKAWMSTSFTQYGSLYYSSDLGKTDGCVLLKEDGSEVKEHRFAVGPSTGREFFDDGRAALEYDRGPWNSVEQYKAAVGKREIACVQKIGQLPRSPLSLYGPGTYSPSRSKKIAALQNYLRVVKFLLPLDNSISSAVLWHPDLHTENIFVHPDRPSEIMGIIDWQSSELLPLFDQARQPYLLDYDGPALTTLEPPPFPDNFDQLDPAEQARAQALYLKMSLSALYRRFTYVNNEKLFRAMKFRETQSFDMMLFAQNILVDGEALYQSRMLELEKEWSGLPGVCAAGSPPIPFQFSAEEANSIEEDASGAIRAMELMRDLRQSVGERWPEKGIVPPDQYDQVKAHLEQAKAEMIARLAHSEAERIAWEEAWPYRD